MWKKVTGLKFSRPKFYKSAFTYSIEHFTSFRVIVVIFTAAIFINLLRISTAAICEFFNAFLTAEISPFSIFLGMWKKVTGFKFSRLKFYRSAFTYSIEHFTSFRVIALIFTVVISGNFPCILNGRYRYRNRYNLHMYSVVHFNYFRMVQ